MEDAGGRKNGAVQVWLLPNQDDAAAQSGESTMPSDLSTWFIAVPNDSDAEGLVTSLRQKLDYARALPRANIGDLAIPQLKASFMTLLLPTILPSVSCTTTTNTNGGYNLESTLDYGLLLRKRVNTHLSHRLEHWTTS